MTRNLWKSYQPFFQFVPPLKSIHHHWITSSPGLRNDFDFSWPRETIPVGVPLYRWFHGKSQRWMLWRYPHDDFGNLHDDSVGGSVCLCQFSNQFWSIAIWNRYPSICWDWESFLFRNENKCCIAYYWTNPHDFWGSIGQLCWQKCWWLMVSTW